MWEAIAANQRRSMWLISLMGLVLVLLGALIGLTVTMWTGMHTLVDHVQAPVGFWQQVWNAQVGIWLGMAVAIAIWLILWLTAATSGAGILLRSAKAREIKKEDAPQLWNVVEEMTIAAGLPAMPRVFIIDDSGLNAFAVGYRPQHAAVAVTAGLLKRLNRDELQGVIAHEIGHIRNQDVRFMTLAAVMVGAIVLLSHGFLRGMFYSGRRRSSRGGGQAQLIILLITILIAVLAPVAAHMLYFACSRRREYLADASSARFTRYPPGLASALEKISRRAGAGDTSKVVAPMYIINTLQARSAFSLFSTHPPVEKRVAVLRAMSGAGFAAYEEAFRQQHSKKDHCIGAHTLSADSQTTIREPTPEPREKENPVDRARAVGEILDKILPLAIIGCPCGVKLKVPPDFSAKQVPCPRCGRQHDVPHAKDSPQKTDKPHRPARYQRRGDGWESFQCPCGHALQLSPAFSATHLNCTKCGRRIQIVPPDNS